MNNPEQYPQHDEVQALRLQLYHERVRNEQLSAVFALKSDHEKTISQLRAQLSEHESYLKWTGNLEDFRNWSNWRRERHD